MSDTTLVMLCAGSSTRFGLRQKKQWLRVEHSPIWLYATQRLSSYHKFAKVIIVSSKDELAYMKDFAEDFSYVAGGNTRQQSMQNALNLVTTPYVMFSDVARCCVPKKVLKRLIKQKNNYDCVVPYLNCVDTTVYENNTINRESLKLIQTPQLSKTEVLKKALKTKIEFTDDSSAVSHIGGSVGYVKGSYKAKKLTLSKDLKDFKELKKPSPKTFVGTGFDIHPFMEDKEMVLGGVKIDVSYGFKAHSDGDVLIHSVIDALLGACGAGDIGEFFPDNDDKYKNIDSKILLSEIEKFVTSVGYEITNIDLTIIAQQPKINPYKQQIKSSLAKLLNIKKEFINIKATTAEKLGFIGRAEGVAVQSIATLNYYNWRG